MVGEVAHKAISPTLFQVIIQTDYLKEGERFSLIPLHTGVKRVRMAKRETAMVEHMIRAFQKKVRRGCQFPSQPFQLTLRGVNRSFFEEPEIDDDLVIENIQLSETWIKRHRRERKPRKADC